MSFISNHKWYTYEFLTPIKSVSVFIFLLIFYEFYVMGVQVSNVMNWLYF